MGTVFLERGRACGPEDAIQPEEFESDPEAILNRMTGLKELYIMDYIYDDESRHRGLSKDILTLIFKNCLGLEYLCVSTEVLKFIPENQLSLKYLCGCLRVKPLLSIMEKSPALEGLVISLYRDRRQEFNDLLPILLTKLPFGLKRLKIKFERFYQLDSDNLFSLFSSEAMKTLQHLLIETNISVTDLPIFSAPELVKFEYRSSAIPDQILRSLAMYSTKLKEVRLSIPDRTDGQAVYFPLMGLEKVCIGGASDELIEILCRNNRNLQSIELRNGRGLTAVSMTHLATLEHLTNIRVCNMYPILHLSDRFCTPTSLLCFLRNRASRPKTLELFVNEIHCKDPQQMVDLKQEIERQKQEDGSLISVRFLGLNDRRVLV